MAITGLEEGLASHALWHSVTGLYRQLAGHQIKIRVPRPQEVLTGPKPLGKVSSFEVRGSLKHLAKDHEIWLLIKDESTPRVWPQGFERVQFNPIEGSWTGRVNPAMGGPTHVTIIAAVVPPTSQDFFRYYQKVGQKMMTLNPPDGISFEPLDRIPAECKNIDQVQATKPQP